MANCHKCGKAKIRKRKDGRRKCTRCGFLPNGKGVTRDGALPFVCAAEVKETKQDGDHHA